MLIKQQKKVRKSLTTLDWITLVRLDLMYTMKTVHCLIFTFITSLNVGSRLCSKPYYVDLVKT